MDELVKSRSNAWIPAPRLRGDMPGAGKTVLVINSQHRLQG